MHAWQFTRHGPYDEVLAWSARAEPEPGPRQAVVEVAAASLNFPDLLVCQGLYQVRQPLPGVPGMEAVGTVTAVGAGSKFRVGERVVGFVHGGGTLAERFVLDDDAGWPVPEFVTDIQAAALSVTYGTSYMALYRRARLEPGETLLVLGAAGGVGSAAIQLGKVIGANVIAVAGSADKRALCLRLGADHVVDPGTEDVVERVKDLTGGRGADVIYDPVGGDLFDAVKRCIAWEGRMLVIGFASGRIPTIECNRMLLKNMAVMGVPWGQYLERDPARGEAAQKHLYALLRVGAIDPVIFRTLPLAQAIEGLGLLASRSLYGKVVLER